MRSTPEDREAAHREVVAARQALRFDLLLRDRAAYLAALEPSLAARATTMGDEDIALADVELDPRCEALALASAAERRELDAACWRAVKHHLGLVKRIGAGSLLQRFALDRDLAEGLILDGLVEALARWNPALGALGSLAAHRIYSRARSWTLGRRKAQGAAEIETQIPSPEEWSDPIRSAAVERALLGLDLEERELVATLVDPSALGELAAERGANAGWLRNRRRELVSHLRRAVARDAWLRRMRHDAAAV